MCTTNEFVSDSGRPIRQTTTLCHKSRNGQPCNDRPSFQIPEGYFARSAPAASSYLTPQLPPTPSYTPRSGTPNYRSGDESDRSGSSSRSKRRSSGIYVSVNGQKVVDMNHGERRRSRDRVVLVDSPPTPPQTYPAPRTAPPSPSMPYIVDAPALRRASSSRRPVVVDDRPRVTIELLDPSPSRRHGRHSSTSSHESRHSRHSSYSDEEERQRRRERREEERRAAEKELKEQAKRARIAKANKEINSRPVAPTPPPPPRHSSAFARPVVEVPNTGAELAEAVRRMRINEDEAQRQRLLERIQPKRHATVGHASRRTRVVYDDGTYRWE